jgi:hypothetical protein
MIPRKYLSGLDADDFDIPGVFGIPHARQRGSWRLVCSYADGKRHKARLFERLKAQGQSEAGRSWEFHHIVEGQHYADVDFSGRLAALYQEELPCVLIAKEEHLAYNRLLHIRETDELYRDRGLPAELLQRSAAAKAAAGQRARHTELRSRVEALRRLYANAYAGDQVLITIANNVLADTLTQLH